MSERVILAAVAGAHGVRGEVRLKLFGDLDSFKRHKTLQAGDRPLTLVSVRPGRSGAVAAFAGIEDRTSAEALRGQKLTVPRSALPALAEGEYYHADLVGLRCEAADGTPLGTVVAVQNFGAGDLIEIARPNGTRALIPFREDIAMHEGGRIVADPAFLA
ncbi:MAG: ribosome maturation factor RimM [Sphingosinicella sp.]